MFAFILGREFKLSIAELLALLPDESIVFSNDGLLVAEGISEEEARSVFLKCGGSIRLLRLEKKIAPKTFADEAFSIIRVRAEEKASKFSFALASFSGKLPLSRMGLTMKKSLQAKDLSVRTLNQKDENINAAAFKKEKLSETLGEIGFLKMDEAVYITTTLLCQDVDVFAERDLGKNRDMAVGMLPPKLARMMANIAGVGHSNGVFDPFCGLGTVLIEGADLGAKRVFGSDIEPKMTESTNHALSDFRARSGLDFEFETEPLDARYIDRAKSRLAGCSIVTEGYLGEVLGKNSVTLDRISEQKRSLLVIYKDFFRALSLADFKGNIVITFPFWDVGGKYVFFEEIQEVIRAAGFRTESLLPSGGTFASTKYGTLLYRRVGQTVGREVTKIRKR